MLVLMVLALLVLLVLVLLLALVPVLVVGAVAIYAGGAPAVGQKRWQTPRTGTRDREGGAYTGEKPHHLLRKSFSNHAYVSGREWLTMATHGRRGALFFTAEHRPHAQVAHYLNKKNEC